jgi:hypothetical protein
VTLYMRVIKVGTSSQSRIIQACDQCRSKKIRCDVIRPSYTQCMKVRFECETSDKLSRHSYPKRYTQSMRSSPAAISGMLGEYNVRMRSYELLHKDPFGSPILSPLIILTDPDDWLAVPKQDVAAMYSSVSLVAVTFLTP